MNRIKNGCSVLSVVQKQRLRLLQRTVLKDFPLFCPKCRQERIINARNFQIEIMDQPDAKTQC